MLSTFCVGNLGLYIFVFFLCIFLAPNSLLYYVVKYDTSKEQLEEYLNQLRFPYSLVSLNQSRSTFLSINRILDDLDELKQISTTRLQFERLPTGLWLAVCTFATVYRLTLPGQLYVDNVFVAILASYSFLIAWRFGSNLPHQK